VAYNLIGIKLVFNTNRFSTYAVVEQLGQMEKYTMTVETAAQHYNPGDTIAANIRISTPVASQFGSFGFTLGYDSTKLELVSITTALEGGTADNTQNGKFTYTILGAKPNPVTSAGVVAATATFKVKAGITTGTDTITLTEPEVIYQGTNKGPMPVVAGKTVNLDNVKVGFAQGTGSTLAAATAYVKYDTAGLWTDNTYATKFAFPVPQAAAGYRLETSKLWGNGASTYTQGEVEVLKFTADTTLTVQTVKTQKVSFATSTGGTISPVDPQTIDKGASLFTLALPTPTPTPGYHFTGWYDGASMVDMANYVVNADITLTAKFGFESYIWTAPSLVGATMSIPTGVTEGKVTHNQPIAFTLTVDANYVVTAVSYTVGAGAATALTPVNGTYTIAGDKILGNIKVEVTAQKYHKVTFSAGIGNTLTTETAYVRDNTAGLFTDTSFGTAFTVPKPVAAETYRLAKDTAEDPLWKTGITGYTSSSINQAALTVDTVLTAQSIKTYVVTYVAGANGALTVKPLTLTVDTGYTLKAEDVPTLTPNSGYKFSAWTAADPVGQN
ncbi:MAG: cohesin domain-containing protein, partial [Oscillospiraceae bacterium]